MKRQTTIRQFGNINLPAIQKVSGNENLTESEVFNFPPFIICRSGVNANGTDITAAGQKDCVQDWVGKAILFAAEDHANTASSQVGRIYQSWTEDKDGETVTYGKGFGIRTDDLKDTFAKIENRIISEMSCCYSPLQSLCSDCKGELDLSTNQCDNGHTVGSNDVVALDTKLQPQNISFCGIPAVENAGLLAASSNARLREYEQISKDLPALRIAADDGREYRQWAQKEFSKWYGLSHPDAKDDAIKTLAEKLSAREMINLGRIEQKRFSEIMPDGKQITELPEEDDMMTGRDRPPISLEDISKAVKG